MNMQYICVGDYYIPDLELPGEFSPIGKWGRMRRDSLREHNPIHYNLLLKGSVHIFFRLVGGNCQPELFPLFEQQSHGPDSY